MFLLKEDNLFDIPELSAKWSKQPINEMERPVISSSKDLFQIIFPIYPYLDMYESFWIVLLSRGNRIKAISNISSGGMCGTVADPKKIFQMALIGHASSIILLHNHPGGNLSPSKQDIEITNRCITIGSALDLPVLDHLIITPCQSYYSFADDHLI